MTDEELEHSRSMALLPNQSQSRAIAKQENQSNIQIYKDVLCRMFARAKTPEEFKNLIELTKNVQEIEYDQKSAEIQQIIIQEGGSYIGRDHFGDYFNQAGEKRQTLAEAAAEIEQLLKQLEKSNPNATDVEKVAFVNDETPPNFKSRVISALKSGGLTTLDIMSSPYSQIFSAIINGWITTEKSSKQAQPNNIDSVK